MKNIVHAAAILTTCAAAAFAASPATGPVVSVADAASNTWARVAGSPTGWREQPIFVYDPGLRRFVMAAGIQAKGGVVPRHYDAEEFDLTTGTWVNAYPAAVAGGRPATGPVGEEYAKARVPLGSSGFEMFYRDGGLLRVAAGGQWTENRAGYEFCLVPGDDGRSAVFAYLHDRTLRYDPARRTYEDLNAPPRTGCRIWGAMAYDPVHREIVHAGGDGGSGDLGTWVYAIDKNAWRKLDLGSPRLREINAGAADLRWRAKDLLGAACNRFSAAETLAESGVDLAARAVALAADVEKLSAAIAAAELLPNERAGAAVGSRRFTAAAAALRALGGGLAAPPINPQALANLRAARVLVEQAGDAVAPEPPGRARSPIAYDPGPRKIVLFGGDGLDRVRSDTWVYDCASRTWEQRFPAVTPLPRAGHILAALPKSGKVVLAGGYSREPLAQDVWVYDVGGDEWTMLLHVPLGPPDADGRRYSANAPRTTPRLTQAGAVNEQDVLVCVTSAPPGLVTWACKIDPGRPAPGRADWVSKGFAGEPGRYTFNRIAPATWEAVAAPDDAAGRQFYATMPANQWTAVPFAKYAPGARNRWGTTAYDADRHQFLLWGGGHATSQENDVAHFSVLGRCWTIGYHPDDPIETVYASQPTPLSFSDRPHVPVHAYKAYCYDAAAGRMLYLDRAYDPVARDWEAAPYPGLTHKGVMRTQVRPTPQGAVAYSDAGLFRLDPATRRWAMLPWDGPKAGAIWCDGEGFCYDSKRHCLWFGMRKEILRYDLASGKAERVEFERPAALGEFTFHGEQVYLPDADLILLMRLFRRPDGRWANAAFDPASRSFRWVELPFVRDGKQAQFTDKTFSWSDALAYDPALKLVLLNNSSAQAVWAMKFDPATARLSPMAEGAAAP